MWHSWLLVFASSLGLVPVAFGDDAHCFPTGNCYTVNTDAMTFDKAKMACGFKGSLASMKTQQEKEDMLDLVTQFQEQRNMSIFWLGLYLPACVSIAKDLYGFVWVSGGDSTEVTEWNNIPKQSCTTKRKCVVLESKTYTSNIKSSPVTLVWKDIRCERKFPSICRSIKSKHISTTKGMEVVTQSSTDQYKIHTSLTDQYTTHTSFTDQHTEKASSTSRVTVPCRTVWKNVTSSCTVTISYVCNATHCSCGIMNDSRGLYNQISCNDYKENSCLQQCIKSMDISFSTDGHHTPCEGEECKTDLPSSPESPISQSTDPSSSSTSAPLSEEDNLLDRFIIPLILGLVAFGILLMLVWGSVQMCIRKRKPKRRKSIIPAPPEASDTDSTDHSSSEEEEEDDEEEEESQDRTEDP